MLYLVTATLREDRAAELHRKLEDGTVTTQRPDGPEIVAAMERARIDTDGRVRWTETCFCRPPLAHERATLLDHHFVDLEVEPVTDHVALGGEPLTERLARHAAALS